MTTTVLRRCLIAPLTLGLVVGSSVAAPAGAAEPTANSFIVRNARIFDGVRITRSGSVLVLRGRIAAVGRVTGPRGLPVYEGRGKTLLPGLIDGHVHTEGAARRDALRFGTTTGLEMAGDPATIAELKRQRRSLNRIDQADVWSAGVGVSAPGGFPNFPGLDWPRLDRGDDADRFVADRIAEGSDHIKIFLDDGDLLGQPGLPTLTPDQVRAVVAAAHRRGRLAVAHATEQEHAKTAVTAGTDGLVHLFVDTAADKVFVREIRRRGTFVTPTLTGFDCGRGAADLLGDPRVRPYLTAGQIESLKAPWPDCPPGWLGVGSGNVRRLHAAGVPITVGTDAGVPGSAHGASMLAELSHVVRAGLTPGQALAGATALPARLYRLADRGRIAPGLRADLLLVNGNPAEDITALRDLAVIWKNGYPIDRTPR